MTQRVGQYHIGGGRGGGGEFWLMFLNSPYSHLYGISVTNIFQIRPFFPGELSFKYLPRSLICFYSLPIFLIFHNYYISIHIPWDMDPCAGLHILAHGSIPLPYLPNLCAVLRPAPLASYLLSIPFISTPCIGLSLDMVISLSGISHIFTKSVFWDAMGHKNASILLFLALGHWGKTPYLFKTEVVENAFEMTMDKKTHQFHFAFSCQTDMRSDGWPLGNTALLF